MDSVGWQAIKGCGNMQKALSYVDAQIKRQIIFQRAAQKTLAKAEAKFEHLTISPREFVGRLHAVVEFETPVGLRVIVQGEPSVRSLTMRGIKKGDVALAIVAICTTPEVHLAFEAVEVYADNFLRCRIHTPSILTTPATKVTLRVVAAVVSPPSVGKEEVAP